MKKLTATDPETQVPPVLFHRAVHRVPVNSTRNITLFIASP